MATLREPPLSPPQSSGGELTPELAADLNRVCIPIYIPNGMEHVKMDEFGAGSSSMTYASSPSYFQPHGYPTPMPASTPLQMHMGHTVVHTPPPGVDDPMSMMGSPPVHSPSGRRASPLKAKLSRTPRERNNRARRGTTTKNDPPLSAPLSELTAHLTNVPLRDMDAWVHRSTEIRLQEKAEKGKVARPMNSFMLYRSAYAERSKRLLSQNNHQVVSSTAGKSWKMEPAHVRDKYEELARIEREAHSRAHPNYKFKPNKGPPTTTRRRGELTPSTSSASGPYDDTPHYEYALSSRASTPFGSPNSFMTHGGYFGSSWNTSHPGIASVQPHALNVGYAEDVQLRRGSPSSQDIQYGASNGLAGLPGGTHDELLQPQAAHSLPGHLADGHMDPQLLDYQSDALPIPVPSGQVYSASDFPPSDFTPWDEIQSVRSSPMQYPTSHMTDDYLPSMHHDPSLGTWMHQHGSF
ncbi:hypothetical protein N7526_005064 [Penicillium atrosanguineum]|nr:hypothetical protein N7526_005064 [Penicillium atrosanguineum]